ncbi:hypothetical protein JVU11DRAFT_12213 [Chiua virens]|nr:hypothetical protein JVU11DRAFT_12213 [Chiua virens]
MTAPADIIELSEESSSGTFIGKDDVYTRWSIKNAKANPRIPQAFARSVKDHTTQIKMNNAIVTDATAGYIVIAYKACRKAARG